MVQRTLANPFHFLTQRSVVPHAIYTFLAVSVGSSIIHALAIRRTLRCVDTLNIRYISSTKTESLFPEGFAHNVEI